MIHIQILLKPVRFAISKIQYARLIEPIDAWKMGICILCVRTESSVLVDCVLVCVCAEK